MVYVHGGGWVLGDKETHDRLVRELAVGASAVIVFVDYDRSPESRYPIAIEQSYAVAGVFHGARRLLLLLKHGLVLGGRDVLALVLRVAEGLDGLGAGDLSCHGTPPHGRSA
ncbi:MAG: alpha/beta hydrolase fold domain-containing protein [Gammaproteobacteria bacterium]